jgi:flagellar basal-body rod modification protein FlgD
MNQAITATGLTDLSQNQKFASMGSEFNKIKEEDFFQLLTVELSSQDPLEPKKDSEFLSQVMQISSLE